MGDVIRAVVQTGPRQLEMREFPRPVIGPDDGGLLRVEACGICGSDVEQYRGNLSSQWLPMVPGHEPLGIIEEVSDSAAARWGVRPGDRVAVEILIPCRSCDLCLAGRYMSCRHRIGSHGGSNPAERGLGPWGGFSEYIHLHPNAILHKVRADIPAEVAVMFNPLGAGVRWAVHLGGAGLGDTVLVLGAGQRGLAAVLAARTTGAGTIIITVLRHNAGEQSLAREFDADRTMNVEARGHRVTGSSMTNGPGRGRHGARAERRWPGGPFWTRSTPSGGTPGCVLAGLEGRPPD